LGVVGELRLNRVMENNKNADKSVPITIGENISYLYYFYHYLFKRQIKEVLVFGTINFLLGLFPILLVIIFEINGRPDCEKVQFYGDGSMIIFCFGVLVSFVTFNISTLIGEKTEVESINAINNKRMLIAFSLIYYLISYKIFEKAQINFARTWEFIYWINGMSYVFIVIAFLLVVYMTYSDKYNYSVIQPYKEEVIAEEKAKKAVKKNKSKKENLEL
jgi:Na+-transporting methylmalonyl-CoA/oxaloacetate decarboxylase gamma subunit